VLDMGIQLMGCGFNKIYVKDLPHEEKENFRFGARLQGGKNYFTSQGDSIIILIFKQRLVGLLVKYVDFSNLCFNVTFTFSHLADAFIQRDLQLRIKPRESS